MSSSRAQSNRPIHQKTSDQDFIELIKTHQDYLLRTAGALTFSKTEAEDLVQETFLKAYRAYDRLKPESQIRAWLLRILKNTSISNWRRKKREKTILKLGIDDELAPWLCPRDLSETAPETLSQEFSNDNGLGDEVVQALREVPEQFRDCVLLIDLHQKTYVETASLTKQPLGTVQSRLFRGRRILKGLLREYAEKEGYLPQAA